jgi:hypothetical protein
MNETRPRREVEGDEEPEFVCSCGSRLRSDEVEGHARAHGLSGEGDVAATLRRLVDSGNPEP